MIKVVLKTIAYAVFIAGVASLLLTIFAVAANAEPATPSPNVHVYRVYATGQIIRADQIMHEPIERRPMRRNWYVRWNCNNVMSQWRDHTTGKTYLCTGDGRVCQYLGHRILTEWLRF